MTRPPDHSLLPGRGGGAGPIEIDSVLHRLLVMVAEAIARSQVQTLPGTTDRAAAEPSVRSDAPSMTEPPTPGGPTV